jgi:hypothetical protein
MRAFECPSPDLNHWALMLSTILLVAFKSISEFFKKLIGTINKEMNEMLLNMGALGRCPKSISALIDDEASVESIFDYLQHFEEDEQARRPEQQGAGDSLSDTEGSVASEAAMPIVDLFILKKLRGSG